MIETRDIRKKSKRHETRPEKRGNDREQEIVDKYEDLEREVRENQDKFVTVVTIVVEELDAV